MINELFIDEGVSHYNDLSLAHLCTADSISQINLRKNNKLSSNYTDTMKYINSCLDCYNQPNEKSYKVYYNQKDKAKNKLMKAAIQNMENRGNYDDNFYDENTTDYKDTEYNTDDECKSEALN